MAIDEVVNQAWTRKHDNPARPVVPSAPRTLYPRSLEELIKICREHPPSERLHAAGSHWSLSGAAISDSIFVETHDPRNRHEAMGRTLYDVVGGPGCLNPDFIKLLAGKVVPPFDTERSNISNVDNECLYPVHIETGKRIYQLYAELDAGDDDPRSLATHMATHVTPKNPGYLGPWAFKTLGAAGGQTVFGALTTGTHGGDFFIAPIADSVLALHLVADGGRHFWIEPESPPLGVPLTDRARVEALYGDARYGGSDNFEFIREDALFDAVLISAGRFGIVYSVVIAAVRQYCLHHERRLTTWQEIRGQINDPTSSLFTTSEQSAVPPLPNKHLNIVVCVTPFDNFTKNLTGVTKAWNVAVPGNGVPAGRAERRGDRGAIERMINAPRFTLAGNCAPYTTDLSLDVLGLACSNADFVDGLLDVLKTEVEKFVKTNGAVVGTTIAAVATVSITPTGGAALSVLLVALAAILPIVTALLLIIAALPKPVRLGQVMDLIQRTLLNPAYPPGSPERMGGLFMWQLLCFKVFSSQQKDMDSESISYAAMDCKDYLEQSCSVNADSIEVFFDATDRTLITYVDTLLQYEVGQEFTLARGFVGYISLRFTGPTRALLGPQRFSRSCAIEISAVRDVPGAAEFIDFATTLALDSNFKGILHWGQRNESTRAHMQERFGDTTADPTGPLHTWRAQLDRITQNGRLDGFSNEFTRQTGLEICDPMIGGLNASSSGLAQPITIDWNCGRNPPRTEISLRVTAPSGAQSSFAPLPLVGQQLVTASETGTYAISLSAAIDLAGERRVVVQQLGVVV